MTAAQSASGTTLMTTASFPPAKFQTFEEKSDPSNVAPRLAALRKAMKAAGVNYFLVPRADAHRGESVPASEARTATVETRMDATTGAPALMVTV